jgi:hypothetical protein
VFHDAAALVEVNATADAAVLVEAGFGVTWQNRTEGFHRAWVERASQRVKIEWVFDSAFRFFPVVEDPVLGYRLHDADLAVNKALAGAGRLVIRDYIDLIHLHRTYLQLGALAWAATGKDPGLSPLLILNELQRHTRYQPQDLAEVRLREPVTLASLKVEWLDMLHRARDLVERLPAKDVGCLYLDRQGQPVTPDPDAVGFEGLTRHFGAVKGSWPRVAD